MARFTPKTFKEILKNLVARTVARTTVDDLEDGGIIHNVLGAVARGVDGIYFQMHNLRLLWSIDNATGEDLDDRAKDFNAEAADQDGQPLKRRKSTKSGGVVVFSRATTVGAVTIAAGAVVKVPGGGPEFQTTQDVTMLSGSASSTQVPIVALKAGLHGNVDAGAITQMSSVTGVTSVTNPAATTAGLEREEDGPFRERLRAYLRSLSRGTVKALKYAALSAALDTYGRVVSAEVIEGSGAAQGTVYLYCDDGAGTIEQVADNYTAPETVVSSASGGERRVFLDHRAVVSGYEVKIRRNGSLLEEGTHFVLNRATAQVTFTESSYPTGLTTGDTVTAEYSWYVGLLSEVQKIIDGDSLDSANYPGYRAAGILVYALPPTVYYLTVSCTVVVLDGYDVATVQAGVKTALMRYVNGLGVNGDVVLTKLIGAAQGVAGVYDVAFTTPIENVVVGDGQLMRVIESGIEVN